MLKKNNNLPKVLESCSAAKDYEFNLAFAIIGAAM